MNIKALTRTAGAAILLGSSLSAFAENAGTQLTSLQLPVMINQTGTYVEAQTNMTVYPGDRLMAMGGGSATVVYANGCEQSVSDNEIAEVGTPESCNTLAEAGTNFAVGSTAASGGAAAAGGSAPITGGLMFAGVMTGGVFAVDAVRNEVSDADDNNDNPPISR
ncbi:MAG: hypothetical protein OSA77_09395 [Halioglobus sp.]|nr:hypothetical protein [Halioglobus sp.]